jgi:hypothetical protein
LILKIFSPKKWQKIGVFEPKNGKKVGKNWRF